MRLLATQMKDFDLVQMWEVFYQTKEAQKLEQATLRDYKEVWRKVEPLFSAVKDYDALEQCVLDFFINIPNSSSAVYNKHYTVLHCFFAWLVKKELLPKNPLKELELSKRPDTATLQPAKIEDVKLLIKACNKKEYSGLRNYTIIQLMMDTGIRTNELVNLVDSHFDPVMKTILIRPTVAKTDRQRTLFLSSSTSSLIKKIIAIKPFDFSPYIFPSRDGNKLSTNQLSRQFRTLSLKAGVKITPYQLRHTFATYSVKQGMNVFILKNLMGHSTLDLTLRYTEIDREDLIKAHNSYSPLRLLDKGTRMGEISSRG